MDINLLRQFDLNSLLTLKVLLETQHVTQAAEKLNLTQSAVSRTLAKLRDRFDDPLLVRSGRGLVITKKAEALLPDLNQVLEQISHLLQPGEFNPHQYEGVIRLATTDYGTQTLLPRLIPLLSEVAPNLRLSTVDWRSNLLTELEKNSVDLMIGGVLDPPPHIYQRIVANDVYQGVVRRDHPFQDRINLEKYLLLSHVMVSFSGEGMSNVDEYLHRLGYHRKVAVTVPHFFAALEIIASTDYMILLPSHFVRRYVDPERFAIQPVPFEVQPLQVAMFWHARTHHDPLNKWFRNFLYENLYAKRK